PFNKYATIGFALSLVLTQGRRKRNVLMKLMSGILSLYNVTGFLGDALSYLRLFALGLATGVIGTVINSMAFMLDGSIIGYFFMIIVLIVGHTFNIAINTLGAYVHSSRLQYVEFFSKFYEGEGIKYNPFRVRTKYINIEPSGDFTIK
ncbi:MAG TPA: V-type ATPase 116kDa subunit family protein, partial [Fusibacter sp.]|nr:V-type ATPase 116kDa subunit family protein [Fusibacter sp.]